MNSFIDSRTGAFRVAAVEESEVESPLLPEARALWDRLRGGRPMPSRRDFDPVEAPRRLLPHLILVDVAYGQTPSPRFRWRLLGTHVTTAMGRDSSGRWFDEIYREREMELVVCGMGAALETRRPCFTRARAPSDERSFLLVEAVDMPLSSDGERVDMILGACHFYSAAPDGRRP